jgi:hypothetical protein
MWKISSSSTSSYYGLYQDLEVTPSTEYTFTVQGKFGGVEAKMGIKSGTTYS